MKGTIELTPDMLAQMVCSVLAVNGYEADLLTLYLGDEVVNYDRVVARLSIDKPIEIFPKPEDEGQSVREELDRMLNPYAGPTTFASRNGAAAQPSGDGTGQAD
jgi:hypothetical protein